MPTSPYVLIPARKGSRRLPKKNRRELAGKPLYRWTVDAALQAGIPPDHIYICTDDQDLIDEARQIPVRAFLQPLPLHRDECRDYEWVKDALDRLRSLQGCEACEGFVQDNADTICPDHAAQPVLLLRPTSPFRGSATITRALEQWQACYPRIDSLRAMRPARETAWKQWVLDDEIDDYDYSGRIYPVMKPLTTAAGKKHLHSYPTQSLTPSYIQTAGLEIFTFGTVYRTGTIAGDQVGGFMVEGPEALDLNDQQDWDEAERYAAISERELTRCIRCWKHPVYCSCPERVGA